MYDNGNRSDVAPKYIVPTQPPRLFNKDTAEFYRSNDNYRAIAYYLDGYLCALLDGHHKAVAAAIEKRPLKALVILPTTGVLISDNDKDSSGLIISGEIVYENELLSNLKKIRNSFTDNRMSESEMEYYLRLKDESFGTHNWPEDILKTAEHFPDIFTVAYMEFAGDLSDSRLNKIINYEEFCDARTLYYIVKSLFELKNPRFKEVVFFIARNEFYVSIWNEVYFLLSKIKDEEVEDFFIEFLVNDEKLRPDITEIVDDYFRTK